MSLTELSLAEAAIALHEGKASAMELLEASLDRAVQINPVINAFTRLDPDSARHQAERLDAERSQGKVRSLLHGIPMAHKDMFFRHKEPPSCGSQVPLASPGATADVLSQLDNAGVVQFGALNMSEFAYNPTGQNWAMGHCRNPWDPERITGGSSSGSAASVAARANFGSLGSDTAASIRVPASICGVTGLKTTAGLLNKSGAMPLSFSLDTIGPIARSAQDCMLILDALLGSGRQLRATPVSIEALKNPPPPTRPVRVGVPTSFFVEGVDAQITAIMQASIEALRETGCEIIPVEPKGLTEANACASLIIISEASAAHGPLLADHRHLYSASVLKRLEQGFDISAPHYLNALRNRGVALQSFMEDIFSQVDVLHAPVVPVCTPRLDSIRNEQDPALDELSRQLTRFTRPINYLGLPALALPAGFDNAGMPVAMQLIGPPHSEADLLALGQAFQRYTDWHTRKPAR